MARPLRIEFEGATYHVMSRGNRRDVIVRDDWDRRRWVEWLERVAERCRWQLFAYCLLDNHYHLFLRTPLANLSSGMLALGGSYTSYYNRRHRLAGHLFQGRYKAHLVEDGHHFDQISRYIHLNPVRAGLAARAELWPWSTCAGYYRAGDALDWVDYSEVLKGFGKRIPAARRQYRRFMEAGLGPDTPSPFADAAHGFLVGAEPWVARIRELLRAGPAPKQVPAFHRLSRVPVRRIARAVASYYGVSPRHFARRYQSDAARMIFAHLARHEGQAKLGELVDWLGLKSAGSVHSLLNRCRQALSRSAPLRRDVRTVIAKLRKTEK